LSGNPVATACGLATLNEITKPGFYEALSRHTQALINGLEQVGRDAGVPLVADSEGGMFGFFFAEQLPQNYEQVMHLDVNRFNRFFHQMLEQGIYLAPAMFEAGFVSAAHEMAHITTTLNAATASLRK
jgi:glutamate-1-semialdehyde 2,1-aminomutase